MKRSSRRKLYQELKKITSNAGRRSKNPPCKESSPCKSISPEEEKHDFFTTLLKGKKCDQSSDNIWKIELTRYLESKKTDDLTCLNFLYNVL
jgi:hypothetical protein